MAEKKPSAEEIFRKNSDEMSDVERMMADIIRDKDREEADHEANMDLDDIISEMHSAPISPAPPSRKPRIPADDGIPKASAAGSVSYASDGEESAETYSRALKEERERKNAEKSKKRGVNAAAVILVLCAAVVIGAILIKALSEDLPNSFPNSAVNTQAADGTPDAGESDVQKPDSTLAPDVVIPTPDPDEENIKIVEPGTIVIISDTTEQPGTDEGPDSQLSTRKKEHSYEVYREDVSWTQAQKKCEELGGHLVNIGSQEEFNEVISLAETQGLEKLWVGCHRENAQLIWENDEDVSFYKWGRGEPSGYDSGDKVTEDYLLLWKFNGEWVYNDSRDDPVKDYPAMYSGQIGYVCEFADEAAA